MVVVKQRSEMLLTLCADKGVNIRTCECDAGYEGITAKNLTDDENDFAGVCSEISTCTLYGCKTGICEQRPERHRLCTCSKGDWIIGGPFYSGILVAGPAAFSGCAPSRDMDASELAQYIAENPNNLILLLQERLPGISNIVVSHTSESIIVTVFLPSTGKKRNENIDDVVDEIAQIWGAVAEVSDLGNDQYNVEFFVVGLEEVVDSSTLVVPSLLSALVLVVAQV
eukprot:TRINITY_DN609_c0_g2_i1.p1 TRINITY_DN609_c0_g2~~TRINITY_DN609_c0_g2_i1.p1  ORF type:complete len:226 (+),score=54.91 TRINITY_DN609_c0_g2_i1:1424-2101(+)